MKIITNKQYKSMIEYQTKQLNKICDLEKRIKKAIEYIETNIEDDYDYFGLLYENDEKKKLLDILKGDDK